MLVVACIVTACWTHNAFAQTVDLSSPDGKIKVALLKDNGTVSYSVTLNGNQIIQQSALGLKGDAARTQGLDHNGERTNADSTQSRIQPQSQKTKKEVKAGVQKETHSLVNKSASQIA